MNWFLSNLLPIGIVGAIVLFGCFLRIRFAKPNRALLGIGLLLIVAALAGTAYVAFAPPGGEETVDEEENDGPFPELPDSVLERLRLPWDSESPANWPVAETLAIISKAAYLPPVDANEKYNELGFTSFMPIVEGSMIGYVISAEDTTVIVFRGTDFTEVSDWFANLDLSAANTPHGQIHEGFYNAYHSMKPQIDTILNERGTKHLWVTGHSLGGALALVCGYDLAENTNQNLDGVITFGQPLVARQELASHLDSLLLGRYARFVNGADVVPRFPRSYAPCGSLVWFTEGRVRRSKLKGVVYGAAGPDSVPVEEDYIEIVPLTLEEYEQLQAKYREQDVEPERRPDETQVFQGNSPWIEEHAMRLYLEKIRGLLGVTETE